MILISLSSSRGLVSRNARSLLFKVVLHHGYYVPHALQTGLILVADARLELPLPLDHILNVLHALLDADALNYISAVSRVLK